MLANLLRGWRERSASNAMDMETSNWIVPREVEEIQALEEETSGEELLDNFKCKIKCRNCTAFTVVLEGHLHRDDGRD